MSTRSVPIRKILIRTFWILSLGIVLSGGIGGYLLYREVTSDLPPLSALREYRPSLVTRVLSSEGEVIGEFYLEKRVLVPLEAIPIYLRQAVIAVEDNRFYQHHGIDYMGILRAFWVNLQAMKIRQGGSTITQQLARSLFLTPERSWIRKLKEAILARRIEQVLGKDQILELYLNQIYFGRGAYGVQAAAQAYFGKDIQELNLAESALLAGLIRSPGRYSPYAHPEAAKQRQRVVLQRMLEEGYISESQMQAAFQQDLYLQKPGIKEESPAPYFVEMVRQYVLNRYGPTLLYRGGLTIYTTLDLSLQKAAQKALREGIRRVDKRLGWRGPIAHRDPTSPEEMGGSLGPSEIQPGEIVEGVVLSVDETRVRVRVGQAQGWIQWPDMAWAARRWVDPQQPGPLPLRAQSAREILSPGDVIQVRILGQDSRTGQLRLALEQEPQLQGALVALDPQQGALLALVGGYDFHTSQFNRAIQARRQPGSAFKPMVYGAALEQGYTLATRILDTPVRYEIPGKDSPWEPQNYDQSFLGPVSLRDALTFSRNVVTVRLAQEVGIHRVIEFARLLGIRSPLARNLSLALGSSGVSLLELTSAMGVLANEGVRVEPFFIQRIEDAQGRVLEKHHAHPVRVISAETAYLLTSVLEDVIQRGTGKRARTLGRPLAGKTGTTNDFTDAWFVGYSPNLAAGVWVGFDDLRSMGPGETGNRVALPIWIQFMRESLDRRPRAVFRIPEGVEFAKIDPNTGLLAPPEATQFVVEVFRRGTVPVAYAYGSPRHEEWFSRTSERNPPVLGTPEY